MPINISIIMFNISSIIDNSNMFRFSINIINISISNIISNTINITNSSISSLLTLLYVYISPIGDVNKHNNTHIYIYIYIFIYIYIYILVIYTLPK